MAAALFGRGREREQRGNRDGGRARGVPGRVRERPGVSWRLQAHRGGRQPGRRWRTAARAADRQLPACSGGRKQVAGTGQHSAGPASGLPGGLAAQVSGPGE